MIFDGDLKFEKKKRIIEEGVLILEVKDEKNLSHEEDKKKNNQYFKLNANKEFEKKEEMGEKFSDEKKKGGSEEDVKDNFLRGDLDCEECEESQFLIDGDVSENEYRYGLEEEFNQSNILAGEFDKDHKKDFFLDGYEKKGLKNKKVIKEIKNKKENFLNRESNEQTKKKTSNMATEEDSDFIPTAIVIKNIPFIVKKELLLDVMIKLNLPLPYAFNYHFDNGVFRGLAFANFFSSKETALVVETLNGKEVGGRKLRVEYKKMLSSQEKLRIEREKREKKNQNDGNLLSSITTMKNIVSGQTQNVLRNITSSNNGVVNERIFLNFSSNNSLFTPPPTELNLNDSKNLELYTQFVLFLNESSISISELAILSKNLSQDQKKSISLLCYYLNLSEDIENGLIIIKKKASSSTTIGTINHNTLTSQIKPNVLQSKQFNVNNAPEFLKSTSPSFLLFNRSRTQDMSQFHSYDQQLNNHFQSVNNPRHFFHAHSNSNTFFDDLQLDSNKSNQHPHSLGCSSFNSLSMFLRNLQNKKLSEQCSPSYSENSHHFSTQFLTEKQKTLYLKDDSRLPSYLYNSCLSSSRSMTLVNDENPLCQFSTLHSSCFPNLFLQHSASTSQLDNLSSKTDSLNGKLNPFFLNSKYTDNTLSKIWASK